PRLRDERGEGGERSCAGERSEDPAIPIHGRSALGRLGPPAELAQSRMIGEDRKVHLGADDEEHRKADAEDDGEYGEPAGRGHDPNPRPLLTMWPSRKLVQTSSASSKVTCLRAAAYSADGGGRQKNQYAGSSTRPITVRCSFTSSAPTTLKNRSCSSARR